MARQLQSLRPSYSDLTPSNLHATHRVTLFLMSLEQKVNWGKKRIDLSVKAIGNVDLDPVAPHGEGH